ncbi:hypothetical protein IID19_00330, partial [Patescibacteria group bacterium]|nr:hypothetical protein [Patescibacteria group bacterium]
IEAGKLSGLEKSKEKRGYLAKLVIERIKNQGQEDLKNVIFSDAIKITGSLTLNQLKIIALIYNLTQTKYTKIRSLDDFKDYITKYINPLLSFKGTNAEFTHLVSCGVAMYNQFGQWSLIELFKKSYSFFFLKPFNKNEVEKYLANPSIKEIIKQKSENEFEITVINSDVIKSILLEKKVKEEIINDLVKLYNSHLFNNPEAEKKIISDIPEIKKVFSKLNKSALAHISLTSIGTVIGATFMQETTGIDINIDKWIN